MCHGLYGFQQLAKSILATPLTPDVDLVNGSKTLAKVITLSQVVK